MPDPETTQKPVDDGTAPSEKQQPTQTADETAVKPTESVDRHEETPEDIKISRAYHQQKAQEEQAERERLQAQLDDMDTALNVGTPVIPGLAPEAAPTVESETPTPAPARVEPDDEDDEYDEYAELANKVAAKVTKQVLSTFEQREKKAQQAEIQRQYVTETTTAQEQFDGFVKRNKVPQDIVDAALKKASKFVTDDELRFLGSVPKKAKLTCEFMADMLIVAGRTKHEAAVAEDDKKKEEQMLAATQPSGSAVDATPTPEINQQLADEIAPDEEENFE